MASEVTAPRFAQDAAEVFSVTFAQAPTPTVICELLASGLSIVCANQAFRDLTGFPDDEVLGQSLDLLLGPATNRADVERLYDALDRREAITVGLLNYRRDGTPFWNRLHATPIMAAEAGRYVSVSLSDATSERERILDLQVEKQLLWAEAAQSRVDLADLTRRLQLSQIADDFGSWSRDLSTDKLVASSGCKALFGLEADAVFGHKEFLDSVHREDLDRVVAAAAVSEREGAPFDMEYRIMRRDGEVRWVAARGEMLRRGDGSALSLVGFLWDITGRKAADEHRHLVMRELSHRMKNLLSIVGVVVSQSLRNAQSLDEARITTSGRITALAAAHDELIEATDLGARIGHVLSRVLAPFDPDSLRVHRSGSEIMIDGDLTRAIAMAIHELATNAVKYGTLSVEAGSVSLAWSIRAGSSHVLELDWRESGGPVVLPPSRQGLGSLLVRRVLAPKLHEPLTYRFLPEGLWFSAALRLSSSVAG